MNADIIFSRIPNGIRPTREFRVKANTETGKAWINTDMLGSVWPAAAVGAAAKILRANGVKVGWSIAR